MLIKIIVTRLGYLFITLFFLSVDYANAIKVEPKDGAIRYRPGFPVSGLLGLPDNNLLIWNWHGRAQLISNQGKHSAEFKLPLIVDSHQQVEIASVISDSDGLLLSFRTDNKSVVLLTDKNGEMIEQWHLPAVLSLTSEPDNRKAITVEGVFSLHGKGIADRVDFSTHGPGTKKENRYNSIKVYIDKKIVCSDGDLSKLNQRPILCKKLDDNANEFQVSGTLADPSVCGDSLLTWGVGKREHLLAVYSLKSGKKISEKKFSSVSYPELICDYPTKKLIVGNNGIEIYAFPSLQKIWRYPVKKGKYVSTVALLDNFIVFEEEDTNDVDKIGSEIVFVPRLRKTCEPPLISMISC